MFGREERQQNNRRKPEENRDRLRQREGETMVIIVSLTQLNPLLSFTIQRKNHNETNEIKRRANVFIQVMKSLLKKTNLSPLVFQKRSQYTNLQSNARDLNMNANVSHQIRYAHSFYSYIFQRFGVSKIIHLFSYLKKLIHSARTH